MHLPRIIYLLTAAIKINRPGHNKRTVKLPLMYAPKKIVIPKENRHNSAFSFEILLEKSHLKNYVFDREREHVVRKQL